MARSKSESQILPDIHILRSSVDKVQEAVSAQSVAQQQATLERMKQEAVEREARHLREMSQAQEISGVKVEIANVAASVKILATSVEGVVKGMDAQNTDLKQLLTLSTTVQNLQSSHQKAEEDRTWLKRTIGGIFITMACTLILGVIAAVYGIRLPSENAEAVLHRHHEETQQDLNDPAPEK